MNFVQYNIYYVIVPVEDVNKQTCNWTTHNIL